MVDFQQHCQNIFQSYASTSEFRNFEDESVKPLCIQMADQVLEDDDSVSLPDLNLTELKHSKYEFHNQKQEVIAGHEGTARNFPQSPTIPVLGPYQESSGSNSVNSDTQSSSNSLTGNLEIFLPPPDVKLTSPESDYALHAFQNNGGGDPLGRFLPQQHHTSTPGFDTNGSFDSRIGNNNPQLHQVQPPSFFRSHVLHPYIIHKVPKDFNPDNGLPLMMKAKSDENLGLHMMQSPLSMQNHYQIAANGQKSLRSRGPAKELHHRLELCLFHFTDLCKSRKKLELKIEALDPKQSISSMNNMPVPRLHLNPSRVDRMVIEQFREHARVITLLAKIEYAYNFKFEHDVHDAMQNWLEKIKDVRTKRESERLHNHDRHNFPFDVKALALCVQELTLTCKICRTYLWSCSVILSECLQRNTTYKMLKSKLATNDD